MRNVLAAVCLFVSLLCALAGTTLHWVDQVARTSEPTQNLVVAVAKDPTVTQVVADQLAAAVEQQLPDAAATVPNARELVASSLQEGLSTAVETPQVAAVWQQILSDSRTQLVTDLQAYRSGDDPPSVTVNLAPLLNVTWDQMLSASNPVIAAALAGVDPPSSIAVPVVELPAPVAQTGSDLLAASIIWWTQYAAAAVLLLLGLVLGTGVARWAMLVVMAALGLIGITILRLVGEMASFTVDNPVVSALTTTVVKHLSASLADWYTPLFIGFVVIAGIGLTAAIVTGMRRRTG